MCALAKTHSRQAIFNAALINVEKSSNFTSVHSSCEGVVFTTSKLSRLFIVYVDKLSITSTADKINSFVMTIFY